MRQFAEILPPTSGDGEQEIDALCSSSRQPNRMGSSRRHGLENSHRQGEESRVSRSPASVSNPVGERDAA